MKVMAKCLVTVFLTLLFVSPVVALYTISRLEKAQYAPKEPVTLEELAYGDVCPVTRMDMTQAVTATHVQVVSTAFHFQELGMYDDPYAIRFVVNPGDRVDVGDVLGYYQGAAVLSEKRGILERISLGSDPYLMLRSLDDLALSCQVDGSGYDWEQETCTLTLGDDTYHVANAEPIPGGTRLLLKSETAELVYGDSREKCTFFTGQVFPNALVVDARCVYAYPGSDKFYIRLVTERGKFVREIEVVPGYTDGEYRCISAKGEERVNEGMFCDSGYKVVVEGMGQP